jgi:hypothetical protein
MVGGLRSDHMANYSAKANSVKSYSLSHIWNKKNMAGPYKFKTSQRSDRDILPYRHYLYL